MNMFMIIFTYIHVTYGLTYNMYLSIQFKVLREMLDNVVDEILINLQNYNHVSP